MGDLGGKRVGKGLAPGPSVLRAQVQARPPPGGGLPFISGQDNCCPLPHTGVAQRRQAQEEVPEQSEAEGAGQLIVCLGESPETLDEVLRPSK